VAAMPAAAALAPAAPAALPQRAGGANLPAGLVGGFSGEFNGGESGSFMVMVGANGQLTGIGMSAGSGNLNVAGMVAANGMIMMGATTQDKKPLATFQGFINPNSGDITGTWRTANGSAQGNFSGKRQ
jgi:hypothetical protein